MAASSKSSHGLCPVQAKKRKSTGTKKRKKEKEEEAVPVKHSAHCLLATAAQS
jgi:hypothetical protein